jgi:hypothetical protein
MALLRQILPVLILVPLAASCGTSKKRTSDPPKQTADQFCQELAKAACNDAVVSACSGGGTDTERCVSEQAKFCMTRLGSPLYFSEEFAKSCIDAVAAAYADAKLTAEEAVVVRDFAAPCDKLIAGPGKEGAFCSKDQDCNTLEELSCVMLAGATSGTCQVPVVKGGGDSCTEPHETCQDTHYCDGQNCLTRPKTEGAACSAEKPCASDFLCSATDSTCQAKGAIGGACTTGSECQSGLCGVSGKCIKEVILADSEKICDDLR